MLGKPIRTVAMSSDGLLIIDKPAGLTSQQVVGAIRRAFDTKRTKQKVGHAGTLDPMATGVMLVGVGKATRLLGHLALHDKDYLATIRLGMATTTDDAEGELVGGASASVLSFDSIKAAIVRLSGDIMQVPSAVSAIKVDGKRAYARVRAGQDVKLAPRPVTVTKFDVLASHAVGDYLDLEVEVTVSSGTYVRALARDLGEILGVGGHLNSLRRTRIGRYRIEDAVLLADASPADMLTMTQAAKLSFPVVEVDAEMARDISFGRALHLSICDPIVGLIGSDASLLALYRPDGEMARPAAVFC